MLARYVEDGLRVLAVARRDLPSGTAPDDRRQAEQDLCLLGFVALADPLRPEIPTAVGRCHEAGLRVHVVTGDHGLTAAAIARHAGIGRAGLRVVTGPQVDRMPEPELDRLLAGPEEVIFARSSPETKLRIADALRDQGEIVAMTGDGVNDAPALRRASIGVAMGRSGDRRGAGGGHDGAHRRQLRHHRGRRRSRSAGLRQRPQVHRLHLRPRRPRGRAVPRLRPQRRDDPAAAHRPADPRDRPGHRDPPRAGVGSRTQRTGTDEPPAPPPTESVIRPRMLVRAWAVMGSVSALLVLAAFFAVLLSAGWHPGADVGAGAPLHRTYVEATTVTFLAIVACQVGTAMASRCDRASLRAVGLTSNPLLLWGIGAELAFALAVVYLPPLQQVFDTGAVPPRPPGDPVALPAAGLGQRRAVPVGGPAANTARADRRGT